MSNDIKIKKGLNIKLRGEAEKSIENAIISNFYTLRPEDFHGIIPKLIVKVGAKVKAGEPVFYSKSNEAIKFVSPVSGEVVDIQRGEKRKILAVKIQADKEQVYQDYDKLNLDTAKPEVIKKQLLSSGCWPFVKQRPYDIIADPEKSPKAIFISGYASAPLAADFDFTLQGKENELQAAVNAFGKLSEGKVHVCVNKNGNSPLSGLKGITLHNVSGPHPAGNVGTQINKIDPVILYRNNGNGTFTDISQEAGIANHAGWGMGIVCADYDDDGDTDIFIGNDVAENFMFKNNGKGVFEEVGLITGIAYTVDGSPSASMGVDCGDYDNDGLLDFKVTSYQQQFSTLYQNLGDDFFDDVTQKTGAAAGTLPMVTWGVGFVDLDNDSDRDLFIACGHLQDNIDKYDDVSSYLQRNILLSNTGLGTFKDVSRTSGSGMQVKLSSRGVGFDDLDNDGDVDVVVLNSRAKPTILRNDSTKKGNWLQIRLKTRNAKRDAVGAHVILKASDLTLIDEVHSGRGYQSHYGTRLHFGLGNHDQVDRIEVRWIGGGIDLFEKVAVGQLLTIIEGSS